MSFQTISPQNLADYLEKQGFSKTTDTYKGISKYRHNGATYLDGKLEVPFRIELDTKSHEKGPILVSSNMPKD
jgi:hypothetical protein